MVKLEPIIDGLYKKGAIGIDDVDQINSALLQGDINVNLFKRLVGVTMLNALEEKYIIEKIIPAPLLMQVLEIRCQELTDQNFDTKRQVLKSAEKLWDEINKPFTVSAILDPEILSLVANFIIPEKVLQKICPGIKVDSIFVDPKRSKLEIEGPQNNELKIFTNWEKYAKNLKDSKRLVLLGRITVGIDTDLARERVFQLIASGAQVATPLKLPHLFGKNDWKRLKEAMRKSSIPDGETVLYLGNMVIKKPFDLATIKGSWKNAYKECRECPDVEKCSPEAIF